MASGFQTYARRYNGERGIESLGSFHDERGAQPIHISEIAKYFDHTPQSDIAKEVGLAFRSVIGSILDHTIPPGRCIIEFLLHVVRRVTWMSENCENARHLIDTVDEAKQAVEDCCDALEQIDHWIQNSRISQRERKKYERNRKRLIAIVQELLLLFGQTSKLVTHFESVKKHKVHHFWASRLMKNRIRHAERSIKESLCAWTERMTTVNTISLGQVVNLARDADDVLRLRSNHNAKTRIKLGTPDLAVNAVLHLHEGSDVLYELPRLLEKYHRKTRQWVLDSLNSWLSSKEQLFWISGTSGLGKSVITAVFFNDVCKNRPAIYLGGVFVRFNDSKRNSVRSIIGILALQLAQQISGFKSCLLDSQKEISEALNKQKPDTELLFNLLLQRPLERLKHTEVVLVIDGLDELSCDSEPSILLKMLSRLPDGVKVLVTSRPQQEIINCFRHLGAQQLIKSEEQLHRDQRNLVDVETYLCDKLSQISHLKDVLSKELLSELVEATNGAFLPASFMVTKALELGDEPDVDDIICQLKNISLNETYKSTLERITNHLQSRVSEKNFDSCKNALQTILSVLVCSAAPLPFEQIAVFASTYEDNRSQELTNLLMNALSLMFAKEESTGLVEPIHKTAVEFLLSEHCFLDVNRKTGFTTLACACATILRNTLPRHCNEDVHLRHALLYGHKYLCSMLELLSSDTLEDDEYLAVNSWVCVFLQERRNGSTSTHEANYFFGRWVRHQLALYDYRGLQLWNELSPLCRQLQSLGNKQHPMEFENEVKALQDLFGAFRTFYNCFWAREEIDCGALAFQNQVPIGSPLHEADEWLKEMNIPPSSISQRLPPCLSLSPVEQRFQVLEPMASVGISPNGQYIYCGGDDGVIYVYETASGQMIEPQDGHTGTVKNLKLSPNGLFIATCSNDCTLRVWDRSTLSQRHVLVHPNVTCVGWNPQSSRVVSGSFDHSLQIWDVNTGEMISQLGSDGDVHTNSVSDVTWSKSGFIASASDCAVRVWDPDSGKLKHTLPHNAVVTCIASSCDGTYIVSLSNRNLRIWDIASGKNVKTVSHGRFLPKCVACSTKSPTDFAVSYDNGSIHFYNTTGQTTATSTGYPEDLCELSYSSSGEYVLTASRKKVLLLNTINLAKDQSVGHARPITCVAAADNIIASSSRDENIYMWNLEQHPERRSAMTLEGHTGPVNSVAVYRGFVVSGGDDALRAWDARTGAQRFVKILECPVTHVIIHPDGKSFLSITKNKITRWSICENRPIQISDPWTTESPILCVRYNPTGTHIVCGTLGYVAIWDIKSENEEVYHTSSPVQCVEYLPGGSSIVWGTTDGIWICNLVDPARKLSCHSRPVNCLAVSDYFIAASSDNTLIVWDAKTGNIIQRLFGHSDNITSITFDGLNIITGSSDCSIRIWQCPTKNDTIEEAGYD